MEGALLDRLGPWTLGAAVVGALLLAAEIGYRLGLGARGRGDDHAALPTSAVEGGLLGLLALLLAFSLSAAIQLHQEREALLVKESSAIGRAALGAGLLPEPGASEGTRLLRDYVDARLELFDPDADVNRRQSALVTTDRVQRELRRRALDAMRGTGAGSAPFLAAVNDLLDVHAERLAARAGRLPAIVLWLELGVALLALATLGHASGNGRRRRPIPAPALALAIGAVVVVILALDRPSFAGIALDQEPLRELQRSLAASPPPAAPPAP